MSYNLIVPEHLDKIFSKLSKKDKLQFEILSYKIKQILENPEIGKPLTSNMTGQRRVHIRHYVLIYEIIESEKIVRLLDYDHHDKIYEKKLIFLLFISLILLPEEYRLSFSVFFNKSWLVNCYVDLVDWDFSRKRNFYRL